MVARVSRHVRERGARATAGAVRERLAHKLYVDEVHVWYRLDLATVGEARVLDEGLRLVRAGRDDVAAAVALSAMSETLTRGRLEDGADLWMVKSGAEAAFVCWTFTETAPVAAAPEGRLVLPETCAVLEDSLTSPAFRGRSIAPAAWERLAVELRGRGKRELITKVGADNIPSRKAVKKAGFVEFATMRYSRRGPVRLTELWSQPGAPETDALSGLGARTPDSAPPWATPPL